MLTQTENYKKLFQKISQVAVFFQAKFDKKDNLIDCVLKDYNSAFEVFVRHRKDIEATKEASLFDFFPKFKDCFLENINKRADFAFDCYICFVKRYFKVSVNHIEGDLFFVELFDITKEREDKIYFDTVLNTIGTGVIEVDLKGNILYVNDAYANILGYAKKELLGKNTTIFYINDKAAKDAKECMKYIV